MLALCPIEGTTIDLTSSHVLVTLQLINGKGSNNVFIPCHNHLTQ